MAAISEYAAVRAKLLFDSYRRTDANNPEVYVRAIAAVLAGYDEAVIGAATSPADGIQTQLAWPPNPAELKAVCERLARRAQRRAGEALPPGFVPKPYSKYYRPPPTGMAPPTAADRARVGAALAAFTAALKPVPEPERPKWRPPTDQELYSRYGRTIAEPEAAADELEGVPYD